MNTPAIAVKNLSFAYEGSSVLQHVSFDVQPGEFIGIIGPNGGGKTTLLKLLMGFLKPTQGTINIFGNPPALQSNQKNHAISVAYVPQTSRYDKDFPITVEEVVLSGLLYKLPWHGCFRAKERAEARRALEEVNLLEFANTSFGTLSGGQAQRVLIARALVSNPGLLLLDEPTASVDNQAEADIYALLSKLKGRMTILMVTHDLRTAIHHVERVLCVQGNLFSLKLEEVCGHFALGLYHPPLTSS